MILSVWRQLFVAPTTQTFYLFNLSHVSRAESILEAELHLFKLRPTTPQSSPTAAAAASASAADDRTRRRTTRDVHVIDVSLNHNRHEKSNYYIILIVVVIYYY